MMINTSKYDKSFIFLVYNVIMIISTVSFNITAEPNISNTDKYAPDYDMIQIEDLPDYYKYYFRPSVYAGQLKIFPVMFFRSIYNCKYLVLPDLKDRYDYGEYSQKFYERLLNLNHQYKTSNKIIKKQENNYDKLLANYSKVTKEAYDAVKKYEDPVEMDNRDSNRKLKDEAVQTYLNTEMEISSDEELHDEFKYIYANYEVHAYPTEKIFYPSTVRQSENDNSLQTLFFNCNNLNAGEYHEVMFLYKFISIIKEDESFFTTTILNILITLGQCVPVKLHPLLKGK
ncbi:uncharacterized protein LOC111041831 isoform X1 [Myzus persicae]|uniref:uncharacterized protein LOC111041831 isoform X1 n=1 Tax=Myzus persicae TaxID=13164 RepID=UPI000B9376F0|nr:uncharacterized protein LOC111041831 isoform X1 [Myzus persicae]